MKAWFKFSVTNPVMVHMLTIAAIVFGALAAKNLNLPAGVLKVGRSEYLLCTVGEFESVDQIGDVIVRHLPGGGNIRLRYLDVGCIVV